MRFEVIDDGTRLEKRMDEIEEEREVRREESILRGVEQSLRRGRARRTYDGAFGMRRSVHSRWSMRYWTARVRRLVRAEGGTVRW